MSTKTYDKAIKEVTKTEKTTGEGSVQTEIKNNKIVITGVTVKNENSKGAEVKESLGKEIKTGTTTTTKSATQAPTPVPAPTPPPKTNQRVNVVSGDNYLSKTRNQVFLGGNLTEDVTLLGTVIQIAAGLFEVDLPADIRDISADIINWEWSLEHVAQTTLDAVAFVPLVGSLKYADEVGTVIKHADEVGDVVKHADEAGDVAKHADEVGDAIKGAGNSKTLWAAGMTTKKLQ